LQVARGYVLSALSRLLRSRTAPALAAVIVPPLLSQFRVGYNLQSLEVLVQVSRHPRLVSPHRFLLNV